jgi:hypothetical protein
MKCDYSMLLSMINAACRLKKGHRGWHRFEKKEKDCVINIRWKSKSPPSLPELRRGKEV